MTGSFQVLGNASDADTVATSVVQGKHVPGHGKDMRAKPGASTVLAGLLTLFKMSKLFASAIYETLKEGKSFDKEENEE